MCTLYESPVIATVTGDPTQLELSACRIHLRAPLQLTLVLSLSQNTHSTTSDTLSQNTRAKPPTFSGAQTPKMTDLRPLKTFINFLGPLIAEEPWRISVSSRNGFRI
jgi:hypothetical protein